MSMGSGCEYIMAQNSKPEQKDSPAQVGAGCLVMLLIVAVPAFFIVRCFTGGDPAPPLALPSDVTPYLDVPTRAPTIVYEPSPTHPVATLAPSPTLRHTAAPRHATLGRSRRAAQSMLEGLGYIFYEPSVSDYGEPHVVADHDVSHGFIDLIGPPNGLREASFNLLIERENPAILVMQVEHLARFLTYFAPDLPDAEGWLEEAMWKLADGRGENPSIVKTTRSRRIKLSVQRFTGILDLSVKAR